MPDTAMAAASANRTHETVYPYQDEWGNDLFHVVRTADKRFFQRLPDGTPGLGDTRRVLYHLPAVLEHIADNSREPIYIVEGEKDVHSLEAIGATATCNPMGAGKWTDEYSELLQSARNVAIVADNDDIGIAHARHVRESLGRVGLTPEILVPAAGKDVTDHITADLRLDQLQVLEDVVLDNPLEQDAAEPITFETWRTFEQQATETIPCIVDGLWPIGALGFIAAPPKKGKTWLGLSLAISVATGRRYLNTFAVRQPKPVGYLALEGHRAAIRGRVGTLSRGAGLNPDSNDLANLHLSYKPRGINIADPAWAEAVHAAAVQMELSLLVVDVLRAAASIKENSSEEFAALRRNLMPILDDGISIALLHHFGKLTELTKERTPGERMSGSGAMYGAMDVGVFITGSDEGARRLRVDFELRDLAEPDTLGLYLAGEGSGTNGGFTYQDAAVWTIDEAPEETDVVAPAAEIAAYVRDQGGEVERRELEAYFGTTDKTIIRRVTALRDKYAIDYIVGKGGNRSRFIARPLLIPSEQESIPESTTSPEFGNSGMLSHSGIETAQQSQNGPHPGASRNQALRDGKTPYLQGKSIPETPTSPTERQADADASQPFLDTEPDWLADNF